MRESLEIYGHIPEAMKYYLRHYGWHFNKRLCEYAISLMRKRNHENGKIERLEPLSMEQVQELLKRYNVSIDRESLKYDALYLANMAMADYWKSSIADEEHLALFIKDVLKDIDAPEGLVLREWLVSMEAAGEPVFWEDYL